MAHRFIYILIVAGSISTVSLPAQTSARNNIETWEGTFSHPAAILEDTGLTQTMKWDYQRQSTTHFVVNIEGGGTCKVSARAAFLRAYRRGSYRGSVYVNPAPVPLQLHSYLCELTRRGSVLRVRYDMEIVQPIGLRLSGSFDGSWATLANGTNAS